MKTIIPSFEDHRVFLWELCSENKAISGYIFILSG
jgi:hypothetical protein